jgi:hypothetical protein
MSQLTELIDSRIANPTNARKSARAAKIDTQLAAISAGAGGLIDDGVSVPGVPAGGTAVVGNRSLTVTWFVPPTSYKVDSTEVWVGNSGSPGSGLFPGDTLPADTVFPSGGAIFNAPVKQTSVTATNLTANSAYEVWLKHTNIWGRSSAWVKVGTTWIPTGNVVNAIQDEVDLAGATISGELGYSNIEQLTAAIAALKIDSGAITGGTGGHLAANTVIAANMAAGDAAFINAWIQTAAISSAKIASLTADKITTGTLTAGLITLTGTYTGTPPNATYVTKASLDIIDVNWSASIPAISLNASGLTTQSVSLDPYGLTFNDRSKGRAAFPTNTLGDWIKVGTVTEAPNPYAGIGFFNDTNPTVLTRGIAIRASGEAANTKEGEVILSADWGNQDPNVLASAHIRLTSDYGGTGVIDLHGNATVTQSLTVSGATSLNTGLAVTGGDATLGTNYQYQGQWTQGFTGVATGGGSCFLSGMGGNATGQRIFHCQHRLSSQTAWRQAAVSNLASGSDVVHTRVLTDGSQVEAYNWTSTLQTVRFTVFN